MNLTILLTFMPFIFVSLLSCCEASKAIKIPTQLFARNCILDFRKTCQVLVLIMFKAQVIFLIYKILILGMYLELLKHFF